MKCKAIKLTWKERRAVQRSIKHWEKDIIAKLSQKGNEDILYDSGRSCPLCRLCYEKDTYANNTAHCDSPKCPYIRAYGISCDSLDGHWRKWRKKQGLPTARGMVASLQRILDKEDAPCQPT